LIARKSHGKNERSHFQVQGVRKNERSHFVKMSAVTFGRPSPCLPGRGGARQRERSHSFAVSAVTFRKMSVVIFEK
jgi:hypothetical protein